LQLISILFTTLLCLNIIEQVLVLVLDQDAVLTVLTVLMARLALTYRLE
jgi:hypothetical protein